MTRQNYSISFSAVTVAGVGVIEGQAVTNMGSYFAPASTANLAGSVSGGYDGIALATASSGSFPLQSDGVLPADVTGLGAATSVQFCNVDASGNLVRATTSGASTIGVVRKDGSVALTLGGAGSGLASGTSIGQVPKWTGSAWVNQQYVTKDPRDYTTDAIGTAGVDASTAIETAISAALDSVSYVSETGRSHASAVVLPAGVFEISRPIRIKNYNDTLSHILRGSYFKLLGQGHATVLRQTYVGPLFVIGQDQLQYPATTTLGGKPFLDCHETVYHLTEPFAHDFNVLYTAHVRHNGCGAWDLDGFGSFTIECFFQEDAGQTGRRVFLSSFGLEGVVAGNFDTCFMFQMTDSYGGSKLAASITMSDGVQYVIVSDANVSANAVHHAVIAFDGTKLRLGIDGTFQTTQYTLTGKTLQQRPWEGVSIGRGIAGIEIGTEQTVDFHGYVGAVRMSGGPVTNADHYNGLYSTYTVPTAPFPTGIAGIDRFVLNWDVKVDDMFQWWYGNDVGYLALSMPSDFNHIIQGLELGNFDMYPTSVPGGGIFCQNTTGHYFHDIAANGAYFHSWSVQQSYDSLWERCSANGGWCGFVDSDTGGNRYVACSVANAKFGFLASAPNYYEGCTVGTWGTLCAGWRVMAGEITIHKVFVDNEAVTGPSRGLVYVIDGHCVLHGGLSAWGPGHYEPLISVAGGSVDLDTLSASGGFNLCPAWVDVVRTPVVGKIFIRVKELVGGKNRTRPPVISSTGVSLGHVVIERDGPGTSDGAVVTNRGKSESYQDSITTTNATPVTVCPVALDQHSTYIIDVRVTARDRLTGDSFGVWKQSHTWTRKITGPVDRGTNGPADPGAINGSNSGAPPTGWTISQVASDYDKVAIQITGDASLTVDWVVEVVPQRIQGSASNISLPVGWAPTTPTGTRAFYEGDAGFTAGTSWLDASGNSQTLTLTGCTANATLLNTHTTIHLGPTDAAQIASFNKGSAGGLTIGIVMRAGAQPYPAPMPSGGGNFARYGDTLFDAETLGLSGTNGWALGLGDNIDGVTGGTYDANAGWLIAVLTATAGGSHALYIAGDRDLSLSCPSAIADLKALALSGNGLGLDVAEMVVYDHALSNTDHERLVTYWKTRFAL